MHLKILLLTIRKTQIKIIILYFNKNKIFKIKILKNLKYNLEKNLP